MLRSIIRKSFGFVAILLVLGLHQQIAAQVPEGFYLEPLVDDSDMAADLQEALTFTKYPTYEQYVEMMQYFASTYPHICRLDTIGRSIQDRLLLAVKISDNVAEDEEEPAFLYTATMHGDELVGYILTLRLIDFLLSNYGTNIEVDRVVNDLEIWINPLSNPDGTFPNDNNHTVASSIRYNMNGKDLNRNFPDAGLGQSDDTTGVELENQYMMLFLREHKFNLSANIHSGAEVVNYPWDHKFVRHPDTDWYVFISQEYADLARDENPSYLDEFVDDSTGITGITNGADWYRITGGRQDYVNYFLQGREVTLELSNTKKLESEVLETYWNYNQWSMINYMSQARYGIHGTVTDNTTGDGIEARIFVLDHDNDSSWISSDESSGKFYRYLKEGIYNLEISANGYFTDTIFNVSVIDYQKTTLEAGLAPSGTLQPDPFLSGNLRIYPNPVRDMLTLSYGVPLEYPTSGRIYNSQGAEVLQFTIPAGIQNMTLNIGHLPGGLHILQMQTERHRASRIIMIH